VGVLGGGGVGGEAGPLGGRRWAETARRRRPLGSALAPPVPYGSGWNSAGTALSLSVAFNMGAGNSYRRGCVFFLIWTGFCPDNEGVDTTILTHRCFRRFLDPFGSRARRVSLHFK
jgi:hypothetical protein